MPEYAASTRIRELADHPRGRELLWQHGYPLREGGFEDVLSQYATLDEAEREGRLRDLGGLLEELNRTPA